MLNWIKTFFWITEEQKQARKDEIKKFKEELDREVNEHKTILNKKLEQQKESTRLAYENNSKIEFDKILDEFEGEFELMYDDTIENMNSLPLYFSSYLQSFKNMCNSYKTRMKIYWEVPDDINTLIEEKIELLESMKEEFKEKYEEQKYERIKESSPRAAEIFKNRGK